MQSPYSIELSKQLKNNISSFSRQAAERLNQAVRFSLPDGGHILDFEDGKSLRELYKDIVPIIKLPYDLITLEYTLSASGMGEPMPMVLLVTQQDGSITFETFFKRVGFKFWESHEFVGAFKADWDDFEVNLKMRDGGHIGEYEHLHCRLGLSIVLNFLAAMNCANASVRDEAVKLPAPKHKNKNKNKKPAEQPETVYKVLVIDVNADGEPIETSTRSEEKNPRKMHLRRGHIRHLKNKTIWVNSCVVGEKSSGTIDKHYVVRG